MISAAHAALRLAADQGLWTQARFQAWVQTHNPGGVEPGPANVLVLRAYLGVIAAARRDRSVPRLGTYIPMAFTPQEEQRAEAAIADGTLDAYRLALATNRRFQQVDCRESRYLDLLATAWNYDDDPGLEDTGRMCSVLSLFSWFVFLYHELDPTALHAWPAAIRDCDRRNAYLDGRDGGRARAAALDAIRAIPFESS